MTKKNCAFANKDEFAYLIALYLSRESATAR